MKVKEALVKVFNVPLGKRYEYTSEHGYQRTGPEEVTELGYMQSYAGDRNLLSSNFESEVIYIDHHSIMGLMAFRMRNNQIAIFLFNMLGEVNQIIRVKNSKQIEQYKKCKEMLQAGTDYSLPSTEFDQYITLRTIGGKRL